MKCPHCLESFHDSWQVRNLGEDVDYAWDVRWTTCPACGKFVVLVYAKYSGSQTVAHVYAAYPDSLARPVPPDVEERYARDYAEASAVLAASPKASAAVSRRVLQDLLREKANVKPSNLDSEIREAIEEKKVPSWLAENLDAVRVTGNFAAHPMKSTNSGEVIDVEPGEAEFLLDVLEGLFDFFFVQPAAAARRRKALNEKLAEAGKPPLKAS